ncbi:MAG TPA: isoprenylcysteine carboxylmethyltransferase family protein [Terriglobia bacterium]|nr:isoprenylcysteine carboxylmethyltransferase family protein [Terriglobia bacterium]
MARDETPGYAAWAARWRVPLGFALGVAYLIFARPSVSLLIAGGAVALAGVAVRAYAAGYLKKNQRLTTSGPYARTRNPLYLGSLLIGTGFAIAGGRWILGLAFVGLFLLIYIPVMRRESDFLRREFAGFYDQYAASVPLFLPRLSAWRDASTETMRFRWDQYRRNREYEAALGYAAGIILLALKIFLARKVALR